MHELRQDDRFCPNCGRAVHETALVPTPEADVQVPSPPTSQKDDANEMPSAGGDEQSDSTESPRDAFINTFLTLAIIVLIGAAAAGGTGWFVILLIVLGVIFYRLNRRPIGEREVVSKDAEGRLVLGQGSAQPVSEAERSRLLDEEVGT